MNSENVLDRESRPLKPCASCGTEHNFIFCPACGESYALRRLTLATLWDDFREKVLGFDSRFQRTLLRAVKDPGGLSKAYIHGDRRKYFGPVGMFFICLTFYILLMQFLGASPSDMMSPGAGLAEVDPNTPVDQMALMADMGELMTKYFKIISFFSVLLLGFFIWIFNLKMRYNMVEHMVFAFYYYSIVYLFSTLQFFFLEPHLLPIGGLVAFLIQFGYFIYGYYGYDQKASGATRVFKAIAIQILMMFIIVFIAIIGVLIYLARSGRLENIGS